MCLLWYFQICVKMRPCSNDVRLSSLMLYYTRLACQWCLCVCFFSVVQDSVKRKTPCSVRKSDRNRRKRTNKYQFFFSFLSPPSFLFFFLFFFLCCSSYFLKFSSLYFDSSSCKFFPSPLLGFLPSSVSNVLVFIVNSGGEIRTLLLFFNSSSYNFAPILTNVYVSFPSCVAAVWRMSQRTSTKYALGFLQ